MIALDARTMVFFNSCVTGMLLVIMLNVARTHKIYPGFIAWSICFGSLTLGAYLGSMRGVISAFLSILVANLLLTVAWISLRYGLRQFFDKSDLKLDFVLFGLHAVELVYFTFVQDSIGTRVICIGLIHGVIWLRIVIHLVTRIRSQMRGPAMFVVMIVLLVALNELIRIYLNIRTSFGTDLFDPFATAINNLGLYLVIYTILLIALCSGLILLVVRRLMLELQAHESALRVMAETDALTGLSNSRAFLDMAQAAFQNAQARGRGLSLIMLDLDYFKVINDTFGHHAGDQVLKLVASACASVLRDTDIIGRLGGDEFAVLLPGGDDDTRRQVTERLDQAVREQSLADAGINRQMSISAGGTEMQPSDKDLETMLRRADAAMYQVKAVRHLSPA